MDIYFKNLSLDDVCSLSSACFEGHARFISPSVTTSSNNDGTTVNSISGLIEVCINNTWVTVCYDGPDQFTEENKNAVNIVCLNMGYDGI